MKLKNKLLFFIHIKLLKARVIGTDMNRHTYTHCRHHTAIEQTFKKTIQILLNVLKIDQIFFNIKFLFTYKL